MSSLEIFERRAREAAPRGASGSARNERLGLEIEQRALLLRVIQPSDAGNPFKPKLRIRNHAMILLAYVFGWRAGEELGLKGRDYDTKGIAATLTSIDVPAIRRKPVRNRHSRRRCRAR